MQQNASYIYITFICTGAPGAACEGGAPVYSRKDVWAGRAGLGGVLACVHQLAL